MVTESQKEMVEVAVPDYDAYRRVLAHLRGHWHEDEDHWDTPECIAVNEFGHRPADVERVKRTLPAMLDLRIIIEGDEGEYQFWG